ncbi:hypothetical protein E2C01_096459 [Portunus trituberculatus]|uniref:Uncharacterized protein n=1 Tax=Portunus trituberculatus TaxID=210409 RepID=A0A5B7JVN7_PORTR|nr:hypothetical protein [Portunus trituberculatus]
MLRGSTAFEDTQKAKQVNELYTLPYPTGAWKMERDIPSTHLHRNCEVEVKAS